jgi:hypothetical protein
VRHAPPVELTCGTSSGWPRVQALLGAAVGGAFGGWASPWLGASSAAAAGFALLAAIAGAAALAVAARPRPCALRWDGASWLVDGAPATVQAQIDLGGWMLLMAHVGPAWRWVAVSESEAGAAWPALRIALHACPLPDPISPVR